MTSWDEWLKQTWPEEWQRLTMAEQPVRPKTLRYHRRRLMLTQIEAAQLMGTTHGTYSAWELGKASPQVRHQRKIAEAFGLTGLELHQVLEATKQEREEREKVSK